MLAHNYENSFGDILHAVATAQVAFGMQKKEALQSQKKAMNSFHAPWLNDLDRQGSLYLH